ncbi:MAG: glycosyltransferase family 39 protein [Candidatus Omnitrophota bacterium]
MIRDEKKILILIIILGVIIRIFPISGLNSGPISYNAGMTLSYASQEVGKIICQFFGNCHSTEALSNYIPIAKDQPPLRYIILHYFMHFGRQEFIIRFPSLLFGIASLFLIYQLGKVLFSAGVGLLSSFFLSLSLWHIHHSSYTEMYTLYTFTAMLSLFFFYKSIKEQTLTSLVLFIVSSALAFYSFYPAVMIILAEFFWLIVFYRRNLNRIRKYLFAFAAIAILLLPGFIQAYSGLTWKADYGDYFWGWRAPEILPSLMAIFGGVRGFIPVNVFIFLLGCVGFLIRETERAKGILLFLAIFFPCLALVGCFFLRINITERYFLFIYPFFLIISAYGILGLRKKVFIILLVLLFNSSLFMFIFSKINFDTKKYIPNDYIRHYLDFKFLADFVKNNYKEGDIVIIEQYKGLLATQYYLDKNNIFPVKIIKPGCGSHSYYRYDSDRIKNFFGLVEYQQNPKRLEKLWKENKRVLLIDLNHIHYNDSQGIIQKWIDINYSKKIKFSGGNIYLFDDELKKSFIDKKTYKCSKAVCFLGCQGKSRAITYPFQRR